MRPTLLISLVDVIAKNQNIRQNLKVFEVAKTYIRQDNNLPKQDLMLSITLQNGDFYQIKGVVENVVGVLNREVRWQALTTKSALFARGESAQITIDGHKIGHVGMLDEGICNYFGIEGPIAACEINLTTIYKLPTVRLSYKPIPKYPPMIEDISVNFDIKRPLQKLSLLLRKPEDLSSQT